MTEDAHICTQHVYCSWTTLTEREREILAQLRSSDSILTCIGLKGEKMVSCFLGWSHCLHPTKLCVIPGLQRRSPL